MHALAAPPPVSIFWLACPFAHAPKAQVLAPHLPGDGEGGNAPRPPHPRAGEQEPTGFQARMRALNRKQIPVCKGCHEKSTEESTTASSYKI